MSEDEAADSQTPDSRVARRNMVVCRSCGATERVRGESFPLGWSILGSGSKLQGYMCPGCARRQLREIEGRLDLDFEGF
ncbi:MAG: hypothetical protein ABIS18_01975 [Actinomycetota bacterium]